MILTGHEIAREVGANRITISPFEEKYLEPNSYGFHLGHRIVTFAEQEFSASAHQDTGEQDISDEGLVLEPGRLYLGQTLELLGSDHFASTLDANRSFATLGVWIQMSAPLGHVGPAIPWTLEMRVVSPVRVYPGMRIGKIAFWRVAGETLNYHGKYSSSRSVEPSRSVLDFLEDPSRALQL